MEEIHKLRAQISNIVHANFPDADAGFTSKLPPPQDIQVKSPFARVVYVLIDLDPTPSPCFYF
jgi:hypothetical protein